MWTHSRASGRRGFKNARNKETGNDQVAEAAEIEQTSTQPTHTQDSTDDVTTSDNEAKANEPHIDPAPRSWFEPVVPPPETPPPPSHQLARPEVRSQPAGGPAVFAPQPAPPPLAAAAPFQAEPMPVPVPSLVVVPDPVDVAPDPVDAVPQSGPETDHVVRTTDRGSAPVHDEPIELDETVAGEPAAIDADDELEDEAYDESEQPARAMADPMAYSTTGLDVTALRESIMLLDNRGDELGQEFYSNLFANFPVLRDMFPAGMDVQRSRLVGALVRIVGSADDRAGLTSYLEALGRDHRKFGVITEHYGSLGSSLILAMRKVLRDAWTERHEKAWIQAYDAVAKIMVDGANRDSVISPPWWDGEVVFHRRVLDDLAVIQVRPHTDYPYRPGQYTYLMSPRRPKLWRAYSMACAPRHDGLLEFHVRAIGAGWVSSALVWRTEAGDVLRLGAPQGFDIANPRSERDLLCIAGGTGIAPVLSGLQELEQRLDGRRVHVFYAGRDRDSLYALPHLESIGVRYRKLTVVPVVSPEGPEDRSPDLMGNIVSAYGDWRRHNIYVAGPTNMVQATLDRLQEQGVPQDQITCDDYGIW